MTGPRPRSTARRASTARASTSTGSACRTGASRGPAIRTGSSSRASAMPQAISNSKEATSRSARRIVPKSSKRGPGRSFRPGPHSKPLRDPKVAARDGCQHLLLVVDPSLVAVAVHVRRVVGRDHQRVDVLPGHREAEVVADERVPYARVRVTRARHLIDAPDRLIGLLRIPREPGDPDVVPDPLHGGAVVSICLKRRVDAEIRPANVLRADRRAARA